MRNGSFKAAHDWLCRFFRQEYRLNHFISTLKKPHIALLDGICMGGGAGVSIHGAFRIATERCLSGSHIREFTPKIQTLRECLM